jgi:hypothetical protein
MSSRSQFTGLGEPVPRRREGGAKHLDAAIDTDRHNRGVETSLRRIFRQRERDDLIDV